MGMNVGRCTKWRTELVTNESGRSRCMRCGSTKAKVLIRLDWLLLCKCCLRYFADKIEKEESK